MMLYTFEDYDWIAVDTAISTRKVKVEGYEFKL